MNYLGVAFIWSLLNYSIYKFTKGNKSIHGECISFLHSTSATILTYYQYSYVSGKEYKYPIDNTYNQNLILFSSFMYFIYDLTIVCWPQKLHMYIGHHLSSMAIITYFITVNKYSNVLMNVIFLAELPVPLYVIYKYLNKYHKQFNLLNFMIFLLYSLIFSITRVIYIGDILLLYILFSPMNKIFVFIPSCMIYSGSLIWVYKIIIKIKRKCVNFNYEMDIKGTSILDKKI